MAARNNKPVRSMPATDVAGLKPLKLNEKTKAQVLAISQTLQQAETLLNTIAATLRDVHGAPDSWQFVQQPDGIYLMVAPNSIAPPIDIGELQDEQQT